MEFLNDQAYDILQKDTAGREVRSAADQFVDGSAHMEVGQGDVAHAVRVPVVGDHGYPVGRLQSSGCPNLVPHWPGGSDNESPRRARAVGSRRAKLIGHG